MLEKALRTTVQVGKIDAAIRQLPVAASPQVAKVQQERTIGALT